MNEGNILSTDRKNSNYCIYCLDKLKTYQRETNLFEFSPDTNGKDLKIRKNDITLQWLHFAMASLCNGYVTFKKAVGKYLINKDLYFHFRFSRSSLFTNKAYHLSWQQAMPGNIGLSSRTSKPIEIQH